MTKHSSAYTAATDAIENSDSYRDITDVVQSGEEPALSHRIGFVEEVLAHIFNLVGTQAAAIDRLTNDLNELGELYNSNGADQDTFNHSLANVGNAHSAVLDALIERDPTLKDYIPAQADYTSMFGIDAPETDDDNSIMMGASTSDGAELFHVFMIPDMLHYEDGLVFGSFEDVVETAAYRKVLATNVTMAVAAKTISEALGRALIKGIYGELQEADIDPSFPKADDPLVTEFLEEWEENGDAGAAYFPKSLDFAAVLTQITLHLSILEMNAKVVAKAMR